MVNTILEENPSWTTLSASSRSTSMPRSARFTSATGDSARGLASSAPRHTHSDALAGYCACTHTFWCCLPRPLLRAVRGRGRGALLCHLLVLLDDDGWVLRRSSRSAHRKHWNHTEALPPRKVRRLGCVGGAPSAPSCAAPPSRTTPPSRITPASCAAPPSRTTPPSAPPAAKVAAPAVASPSAEPDVVPSSSLFPACDLPSAGSCERARSRPLAATRVTAMFTLVSSPAVPACG